MNFEGNPKQFSPVTLAFLGDGVFELLVRERLLEEKGDLPASKLHKFAVEEVCASAQAHAYEALWEILTETEQSILKRGRNANSVRTPKSCTVEEYRKATGIEALFGYLHLCGQTERIRELFACMMEYRHGTNSETAS